MRCYLADVHSTILLRSWPIQYKAQSRRIHPWAEGWTSDELMHSAEEQARRENLEARECAGILVCDTDAWATSLWREPYAGHRSPAVAGVADRRPCPALYLLTADDVPFVQDGARGGESFGHWMPERFLAELSRPGLPWQPISGNRAERLQTALEAVRELSASRRA